MKKKNHSKQSSTNKIKFIYQEIHEKETLQIFSYSLVNIPVCVQLTWIL